MALLDDDDLLVVAITPVVVMFAALDDDGGIFRTGRERQCERGRDESGDSDKHKTHVSLLLDAGITANRWASSGIGLRIGGTATAGLALFRNPPSHGGV